MTDRPDPTADGRRRVALYGGSFDPPHLGHVIIATWALCTGRFDEVRLVPTFGHAFGKVMTGFETRCELVASAVAHLGERVRVEPIEASLPTPSYTVDTVRALRAREPDTDFTWIVGTDAYASRAKWREWDALAALVDFLVVGRDGAPEPDGVPVALRLPDVSSTEVRARVAAGEPIWWLVPPVVGDRVAALGLYRDGAR